WVTLHRRVVLLEGVVALGVALPAAALVVVRLSAVTAGSICLVPFVAYLAVAVFPPSPLPLPAGARASLDRAVREEEREVPPALASLEEPPIEAPGRHRPPDATPTSHGPAAPAPAPARSRAVL